MATSFKAYQLTIKDLFSSKYRFHIPDYQRQYSWQKDHAEQLYDDIADEAFSSGDKIIEMRQYFVGSMVLVQKPDLVDATVIDGQQRITTLTILLAAIRDVAAAKGTMVDGISFADSVESHIWQKGNPASGVVASYQLHIRPADADFFQKNVQAPGKLAAVSPNAVLSDSQRRLVTAGRCFFEKLNALSEEKLTRLGMYLLQRVAVALVVTDDEESAFRIFSILNDRGLDLSPADILKAEVIGAISEKERPKYSSLWEEREKELGSERFNEMIAHIRMIAIKRKSKESTVKEIRQALNPKRHPEIFINEYVVPFADIMAELRDAEIEMVEHKDEISRIARWLRELRSVPYLGNSDWVPVALILVKNLREKPAELLAELQKLEALTFGVMGLGLTLPRRIERFGKILVELETGKGAPSLDLTVEEKARLLERLSGDLYSQYYCSYLLRRLDEHISGTIATYESKKVTVEHILPQNPSAESQWLKDFSDEEVRKQIVNRLGNLTLLSGSRNSSLGNSDYAVKLPKYFKKKQGHFALTARLVSDFPTWTPKDFDARQVDLHVNCGEIWGLSTPAEKA